MLEMRHKSLAAPVTNTVPAAPEVRRHMSLDATRKRASVRHSTNLASLIEVPSTCPRLPWTPTPPCLSVTRTQNVSGHHANTCKR